MATIKELADFMAELPEDTCAVLVVQRGVRPPLALRTGSIDPRVGNNWVRAVWEGMFGEEKPRPLPSLRATP